jgi:hypothetical protein
MNIDPRKTRAVLEKKINKNSGVTLREKILLSLFLVIIIIAGLLVFLRIR